MISTFGTGQASNDLLCVCRVILESDPQQVVHRVALRVSKNVQPLLSTGSLKPSLLSVAEGAAHKHILPFPILTHVWILLLPFHLSVPEKRRNFFVFLTWNLAFYIVLHKMATLM